MNRYIVPFEELGLSDIPSVGGKNASMGEMISHLSKVGVRVPSGFATTAFAYHEFLAQSGLATRISEALRGLDVDNLRLLAETGANIRSWIVSTPIPDGILNEILGAWMQMGGDSISVAVRSSATAEDLPDASFAGQQDTFLNVRGKDHLLRCVREVYASLFNDRAIAYRVHQGFDHDQVALSVGVQYMVRSDLAASGVVFTLDTESGFRDVVFVTSSYGLGENIVQGAVNPDEFYVYKPSLAQGKHAVVRKTLGSKEMKLIYATDPSKGRVENVPVPEAERARFSLSNEDLHALARMAVTIEKHYGRPMDIEWGKDGSTGEIWILQARPETVKSRSGSTLSRYSLKAASEVIAVGRAIGQRIGAGVARVIHHPSDMDRVAPGDVLVADMTDPDWEPIMKRASAIVTNRGGRTCHAAIIARELGIPAVVGCADATERISEGAEVTVSCAEGETGNVYAGILPFVENRIEIDNLPKPPLKVMMNLANPDLAFGFASLPHQGVGLARLEFIINRMIGVHPRALMHFADLSDELQEEITRRIAGYESPVSFFVDKLTEGIATIAAAFAPEPVIVRLSDFKSNEYANLLGGRAFEPTEENPMIGFRGASRYLSKDFAACFELECRALRRVREDMGLRNVQIMVPFVRTVREGRDVVELLAKHGLARGQNGLKVIMMCEIPSNALLADKFLDVFDGMSIGSNDMTQLTLGVDRDSALVAELFDERDEAVKQLLSLAIRACRDRGKYIGICGQGPSDHPDFARWLADQGIESMSLNPDTVVETILMLSQPVAGERGRKATQPTGERRRAVVRRGRAVARRNGRLG